MPTEPVKIKERTRLIYLMTFWVLSAFCIVFEVLCVKQTTIPLISARRELWVTILTTVTVFLFLLSVFFVFADKPFMVKMLLSGNVFVAFALTVLFILQKTDFFLIVQNTETFENFMKKAGAWMPLLFIIIQFLQVVVLPIPGIVSTLAGVALFGAFKTAIFSLIGIWLGSVFAFYIGRKFGKRAVTWLIGAETLEKWQTKLKGKDNLVLTVMFLLPFFPDDILCFIAGLSTMSTKYFFVMMTLCRIIAVFSTCYSLNIIPFNTPWGIAIWAVLILTLIGIFAFVYKYLNEIDAWFKRLGAHIRKKTKYDKRKK